MHLAGVDINYIFFITAGANYPSQFGYGWGSLGPGEGYYMPSRGSAAAAPTNIYASSRPSVTGLGMSSDTFHRNTSAFSFCNFMSSSYRRIALFLFAVSFANIIAIKNTFSLLMIFLSLTLPEKFKIICCLNSSNSNQTVFINLKIFHGRNVTGTLKLHFNQELGHMKSGQFFPLCKPVRLDFFLCCFVK